MPPDQEKDLFELRPDLKVKLEQLRRMIKELGLMGKVEFS